jgi:hypothetical protein
VIAILESRDPEFVNEAAKRGIFAYVTDGDREELQSAVDIVLPIDGSPSYWALLPPAWRGRGVLRQS